MLDIAERAGLFQAQPGAADTPEEEIAGPHYNSFVHVSMTFQAEDLDVRQFSFLVTAIDELCAILGSAMAVYLKEGPLGVSPPQLLSAQMSSPLTIEIGATAGAGAISFAVLRVLAAVVRDPSLLGGFIPKVKTGWYDARTAQYEAQMRLEAVRKLAGDVTVSLRTSETPAREERLLEELDARTPHAQRASVDIVAQTGQYL